MTTLTEEQFQAKVAKNVTNGYGVYFCTEKEPAVTAGLASNEVRFGEITYLLSTVNFDSAFEPEYDSKELTKLLKKTFW